MAYEFIQTENRDGVLVLTMHDPPTRNALGPEMAAEVRAELDRFEDDPGMPRAAGHRHRAVLLLGGQRA